MAMPQGDSTDKRTRAPLSPLQPPAQNALLVGVQAGPPPGPAAANKQNKEQDTQLQASGTLGVAAPGLAARSTQRRTTTLGGDGSSSSNNSGGGSGGGGGSTGSGSSSTSEGGEGGAAGAGGDARNEGGAAVVDDDDDSVRQAKATLGGSVRLVDTLDRAPNARSGRALALGISLGHSFLFRRRGTGMGQPRVQWLCLCSRCVVTTTTRSRANRLGRPSRRLPARLACNWAVSSTGAGCRMRRKDCWCSWLDAAATPPD
eukprot:SAG22_NODE_615_length_8539_cov_7.450592_3_plen_259_part_00